MLQTSSISLWGAFIAGILSFLSPCVLPLIPSYISFVSGLTITELKNASSSGRLRIKTAAHSLVFISGFTTVFVLMGVSATLLGTSFHEYSWILRKAGGILIIIFGVHITGLLPIHLLFSEKRYQIKKKPAGYIGSYFVGVAFAAGWTPCIGPILGSILVLAATESTVVRGFILLFAYSAGLGVPFIIASFMTERFIGFFNSFKKFFRAFEIATGVFLIIVGLMIFFNWFTKITSIIPI